MKKIGLLIILLAILVPPLHAEENNVIYNTLMTNYIAMCWADLAVSYYGLDKGCKEMNPIARFYIDKPGLAIAFIAIDNRNKVVAIGLIVLVTIAKGYILYRNLQEWR